MPFNESTIARCPHNVYLPPGARLSPGCQSCTPPDLTHPLAPNRQTSKHVQGRLLIGEGPKELGTTSIGLRIARGFAMLRASDR